MYNNSMFVRGSGKLLKCVKKNIKKKMNFQKTALVFLDEVECLGACVSAPMLQINDDYYEDLNEKNTLDNFSNL